MDSLLSQMAIFRGPPSQLSFRANCRSPYGYPQRMHARGSRDEAPFPLPSHAVVRTRCHMWDSGAPKHAAKRILCRGMPFHRRPMFTAQSVQVESRVYDTVPLEWHVNGYLLVPFYLYQGLAKKYAEYLSSDTMATWKSI